MEELGRIFGLWVLQRSRNELCGEREPDDFIFTLRNEAKGIRAKERIDLKIDPPPNYAQQK